MAKHIGRLEIDGKVIISTLNNDIATSSAVDKTGLIPCNYEEADKKILIRTVDTDIVVIAIAMFLHLQLEKLWIAFGTGKHFCYIPVHYIANTLGENMSKDLPLFHAMTGFDTVFYVKW